ncbi:hypothetical protein [Demequina globuliformis]|uniref:hypothetical protein n=1 Tax=Demequina globuliformis TaxID=676202 RepID=UPI000785C37E|nr:hypothetical protein [Demequina globuliformis]
MYNAKLRRNAVESFNTAVERYEATTGEFEAAVEELFELRKIAANEVRAVTAHINSLANVPKEFTVSTAQASVEIRSFEDKQNEINKAESLAKRQAKGSAAGASLGALGVAVATMGPTAAMGVATTFGVASTGTAIASLSGAAATNAALAWLGGGAIAAGGSGMAAGSALLAAAGPVGWAVAGAAGLLSVGIGVAASAKNKRAASDADVQRKEIEEAIRRFDRVDAEIHALTELTDTQVQKISSLKRRVPTADYVAFSDEEKALAAALVNGNLTLAQLVNREITVDV